MAAVSSCCEKSGALRDAISKLSSFTGYNVEEGTSVTGKQRLEHHFFFEQ